MAVGSLASADVDDAANLHRKLAGLGRRQPPDEVRNRVFVGNNGVHDQDYLLPLFVVADLQPSDLDLGCTDGGVGLVGLEWNCNLNDLEMGKNLFECRTESLKMLLFEPENDGLNLITDHQPEPTLPRRADSFGIGTRHVFEFGSLHEVLVLQSVAPILRDRWRYYNSPGSLTITREARP